MSNRRLALSLVLVGVFAWAQGTTPGQADAAKSGQQTSSVNDMIKWISDNKQWVFSGVGVLGLSGLASMLRYLFRARGQRAHANEKERVREGSGPVSDSPAMTSDIPLTTQTLNLSFDTTGSAPALTMRDGKRARADMHIAWRVTNPYLFCFSSKDHPFDVLGPLLLARTREFLEGLTLDDARARRREAEKHLTDTLVDDFKKRGIQIESILIGAVEQLGT